VREDSPMRHIKDLKGKRVSAGFTAQKAIGRIIEAHLANAGLSYDDVQKVLVPNVRSSADDFIGGKTDVLFFALGSAAVKQAAASVGGLRVLTIEDTPEARERMQKVLPGSYVLNVKPAPNIEGIKEPTNIVAFDMQFFTNKDVSDDIVYAVTKALHQNKAALVEAFRPMAMFDPKKMAKPLQSMPFHPGALKYYQEVGLVPKS
jgi:TRAP transporter TAXI family solute receptor